MSLELCNPAFKTITNLDTIEGLLNEENLQAWQNKKIFQIAENIGSEEHFYE